MRIARLSRGYDPRWLWQGRALASSAGTLFIRSFERGERIHVAMLSRGFTGELPAAQRDDAGAREWLLVSIVPLVAAAAALTAWTTA
jgi:cobalt/nickel transport system permease protein